MTTIIDGTTGITTDGLIVGVEKAQLIKLETVKTTTSGTTVDFTGIPTWAKKITVMFSGVSTNGTNGKLIQIGSGSIDTTGYLGAGSVMSGVVSSANNTAGFLIFNAGAANLLHGSIQLTLLGSNLWTCSGVLALSDSSITLTVAGTKTISSTLDRIRITTVGGTDTFDAGSVNILIEGSL
jgi:hypothetical protein